MSSRKGNGVFAAVNTCTSTLCIKKVHSVAITLTYNIVIIRVAWSVLISFGRHVTEKVSSALFFHLT